MSAPADQASQIGLLSQPYTKSTHRECDGFFMPQLMLILVYCIVRVRRVVMDNRAGPF